MNSHLDSLVNWFFTLSSRFKVSEEFDHAQTCSLADYR